VKPDAPGASAGDKKALERKTRRVLRLLRQVS